MANPTCTSVAALIAAQPCFGAQNLDAQKRKSLLIWFKVNELAAIGGTDYRTVLASTLIRDATTFAGQATSPSVTDSYDVGTQFDQAKLAIAFNSATTAGASLSTNINTLMGSIAPLSKATERQLDSILIMLECKLGAHKAYPQ